jgi:hypothetical protein
VWNFNAIIKALHPDRTEYVTRTELATAQSVFTTLRPLFDEG